jgi:hypothetical protein
MINLTAPDGSPVVLDGRLVVRARRTIAGEDNSGRAKTRIDWVTMQLVRETIDQVAPLVRGELASFTALTAPDGSKIWFNAKQAIGPLPITPGQPPANARSSIRLLNARQFVTETPQQVRDVLTAAGGTPLPIPVLASLGEAAPARAKTKKARPRRKAKRTSARPKAKRPAARAKAKRSRVRAKPKKRAARRRQRKASSR